MPQLAWQTLSQPTTTRPFERLLLDDVARYKPLAAEFGPLGGARRVGGQAQAVAAEGEAVQFAEHAVARERGIESQTVFDGYYLIFRRVPQKTRGSVLGDLR